MTIFVLGGEGFVGSAMVRAATRRGYVVTAVTLENYRQWRGRPCDVLINANGNSKKFLADRDPVAEFDASVTSVLRSLLDFPCKRYVYLSTIDVYPRVDDRRLNRETAKIDPERLSRYGLHKFLAEQLVRKYAPRWLICRLGGMVGEGLWKNPIFDILHDQPLRVHAESSYQYLNTDDAARIVLTLLRQKPDNDVFNVCGDGSISFGEVAVLAGKQPVRYAVQNPPTECYQVHIGKLQSLVSVPTTEVTIRRFVRGHVGRRAK